MASSARRLRSLVAPAAELGTADPLARGWGAYLIAIGGVALVTGVLILVGVSSPDGASMLYIIVVLLTAAALGRGQAIVAAVAAFLASNFFFVEPRFTLRVDDPREWVDLTLLLVTALITGTLASALRARAVAAAEHERQARLLYDIAVLMGEPNLGRALESVAERLRHELGASAVRVEVAGRDPRVAASAVAGDPASIGVLHEARRGNAAVLSGRRPATAGVSGEPGRWIRIAPPHAAQGLRGTNSRIFRIPFEGHGATGEVVLLTRSSDELSPGAARLLSAAAAQLGPALERAQLREASTEAEILRRTDEARSALLDAVSHDLRTPLASIVASAGSLRQDDMDWSDEARRAFAQTIEGEAARLDRIVGNLLDLSRLEGGALVPDRSWFDPAVLVRDVVERLRPLTARHDVRLEVAEELSPVLLDYSEIDQVLSNLLENAARHTPPGSRITVRASVDTGQLRVSVEDDGPGIAGTDPARLFDTMSGPRPRGPRRGLGLGLAVARGLVEAHDGRINAENLPGGGARFEFVVPSPPPPRVGP